MVNKPMVPNSVLKSMEPLKTWGDDFISLCIPLFALLPIDPILADLITFPFLQMLSLLPID